MQDGKPQADKFKNVYEKILEIYLFSDKKINLILICLVEVQDLGVICFYAEAVRGKDFFACFLVIFLCLTFL